MHDEAVWNTLAALPGEVLMQEANHARATRAVHWRGHRHLCHATEHWPPVGPGSGPGPLCTPRGPNAFATGCHRAGHISRHKTIAPLLRICRMQLYGPVLRDGPARAAATQCGHERGSVSCGPTQVDLPKKKKKPTLNSPPGPTAPGAGKIPSRIAKTLGF